MAIRYVLSEYVDQAMAQAVYDEIMGREISLEEWSRL
jgi:hypothetical protein